MRSLSLLVAVALGVATAAAQAQISATRIASDLDEPVFLTAPQGDPRIFIVQRGGTILVMQNGAVLGTPFLDISAQINDAIEGGLLGMAFHPDYHENGIFYLYFTGNDDVPVSFMRSVVARFTVEGDPETSNVANPASQTPLFDLHQPMPHHNGGTVAIRDGFLYLGLGDGGATSATSQDDASLFGKILRLDLDLASPDNDDWVVYAKGLRNPFRFSFDRLTGDLYIGDVGQALVEEIDAVAADAPFGLQLNFGWDVMEGDRCNRPNTPLPCNDPSITDPIFTYGQIAGPEDGAAVSGGVVYRGNPRSNLYGWYFFGDSQSGRLSRLRWTPQDGFLEHEEITDTIEVDVGEPCGPFTPGPISRPVAFGEDGFGEVYAVDICGEIFLLAPEPGATALGGVALAALAAGRARRLRSRRG